MYANHIPQQQPVHAQLLQKSVLLECMTTISESKFLAKINLNVRIYCTASYQHLLTLHCRINLLILILLDIACTVATA